MSCCKKKNQSNKGFEPLQKIIIYDDPSTPNLELNEIKNYLVTQLNNVEIIARDDFFSYYLIQNPITSKALDLAELARELANTKVRNIYDPDERVPALKGEIAFEERSLAEPKKSVPGVFYDGIRLNELCQELLSENELDRNTCHIIFTPRLFGTFDKFDKRYHARVILCSYPSMISTSGIIEAPAKPKEYYKIKQSLLQQDIATIDDFVPNELKEKYLRYNDPRLTDVLKGYVMQAIFYHLHSAPFCAESKCRLFNSHWQEEVLKSQLTAPEFCEYHAGLLEKFNQS